MHEHSLTWFSLIPLIKDLPVTLVTVVFVGLLLVVISIIVKVKLSRIDSVYPESKVSLRTILELLVEGIYSFVEGIMGEHGRKYVPLIGSIFIFILTCNLIGLIPGFSAPTGYPPDDLMEAILKSPNFACALFVFFMYNYYGFKEHGLGYIKHFFGPFLLLAPLIFTIELIGHIVRPITLSVRLFANIMADHLAVGIFSILVPVGVPALFLGLGLMVCFIQAFVFSLLTTIYIMLATQSEH